MIQAQRVTPSCLEQIWTCARLMAPSGSKLLQPRLEADFVWPWDFGVVSSIFGEAKNTQPRKVYFILKPFLVDPAFYFRSLFADHKNDMFTFDICRNSFLV